MQHIRWEPRAGEARHFFDDELVPASRGVNHELLYGIAPFPTKEVVPYEPSFVAGWIVEQYQIDLTNAAQQSHQTMGQQMITLCSQQVGGDTQRNLSVRSDFRDQTFKHVLLPIWLLTYNYGRTTYHVVANGYTGQIAGKHPLSAMKIFFAVLAAIIVALIIFAASQR